MNINRVLGSVVLAITASTASADEPTSIAQVKTLVIHDVAATAESAICLADLEERLAVGGFTLVSADAADAEMTVAVAVMGGKRGFGGALFGSLEYDVNYLIKVLSLPSHRELLSFKGHQENSLESACKWMAKRTLSKIEEARKESVAPESKASDKPK